jgi:heme O synthase-like polyprenyltransferase
VLAVLRIIGLAVVIALAATTLAWLLTGDTRWRRLAWLIFKYAVFALAAILVLFAAQTLVE